MLALHYRELSDKPAARHSARPDAMVIDSNSRNGSSTRYQQQQQQQQQSRLFASTTAGAAAKVASPGAGLRLLLRSEEAVLSSCLFKDALALRDYSQAWQALLSNPDGKRRKVSALCCLHMPSTLTV